MGLRELDLIYREMKLNFCFLFSIKFNFKLILGNNMGMDFLNLLKDKVGQYILIFRNMYEFFE